VSLFRERLGLKSGKRSCLGWWGERDFTKYHMFLDRINIFVDSGSTFQSTNQIWGTSLQFMSSLGLEPVGST